jgi:tripartite-type tricarboxylate transporter receptor subunit TctC
VRELTSIIYGQAVEQCSTGSAPALTDVVAGHVPVLFSDPVPALPLIHGGKVRALGVSTTTRSPSAPDIPPIAEAGVPGAEIAALKTSAAALRPPTVRGGGAAVAPAAPTFLIGANDEL